MADGDRPVTGIGAKEAAAILGFDEARGERSVSRLVAQGVLSKPRPGMHFALDRAEVERVSLERYRKPHPYWVRAGEVAAILQVARSRVGQLRDKGRLPYVEHQGRYFYRRHQVEVIANARLARRAAAARSR